MNLLVVCVRNGCFAVVLIQPIWSNAYMKQQHSGQHREIRWSFNNPPRQIRAKRLTAVIWRAFLRHCAIVVRSGWWDDLMSTARAWRVLGPRWDHPRAAQRAAGSLLIKWCYCRPSRNAWIIHRKCNFFNSFRQMYYKSILEYSIVCNQNLLRLHECARGRQMYHFSLF